MSLTAESSLEEVAARVSEALEDAGIRATLSGGSAVSLYSANRYQSVDLDFVTYANIEELARALGPLGFEHVGSPRRSAFAHPKVTWYLEFPPGPIAFGHAEFPPEECALLETEFGRVRIISPTQSVMDRLCAAHHWRDAQSMEQALLVASSSSIDWVALEQWAVAEGAEPALAALRERVAGIDPR